MAPGPRICFKLQLVSLKPFAMTERVTWPAFWFFARHVLPNQKYHIVEGRCLISVGLCAEKDFGVVSSHFS